MENRRCFDRSRLSPPQSFYERQGFTLSRPNGKGWCLAKGQPPCHRSKSGRSFSINLDHGGFQCFGCGSKGDMVKFVMLRDRCDFKAACQTLGAWRGNITADERLEITRREQEREWNRQREAEQKEAARQQRLRIRDEMLTTARIYYNLDTLLHELGPEGTEAESCWSVLPPTLDCWRLEESAYCRAANLEDPFE